jgi:hypothetical protein
MCNPCLHFVGFRDDAYTRAVMIFGTPDFVHRIWDRIAHSDVIANDIVVFANDKDWQRFLTNDFPAFSFNDSVYF